MKEPITFTEPSYLLMRDGMAMMDPTGRLAIFNTQGMADHAAHQVNAKAHRSRVTVQPVSIKPAGQAHPSNVLNPESAILQQLDSHWQQVAALLLWKLARVGVTTLTMEEIASFPQHDLVLMTHGHKESIDFSLVTKEAAEKIVAHDRGQAGHA
jgi:hypothetical protein